MKESSRHLSFVGTIQLRGVYEISFGVGRDGLQRKVGTFWWWWWTMGIRVTFRVLSGLVDSRFLCRNVIVRTVESLLSISPSLSGHPHLKSFSVELYSFWFQSYQRDPRCPVSLVRVD